MAMKKKLKAKAKTAAKTAKTPAKSAKKAIRKVAKKARKAQPIPKGFHTITASLVVNNAREAIEFYKTAFGAKERKATMTDPSGKIMHSEIVIGDSIVMVNDEFPEMGARSATAMGGSPASLMIYTRDANALFDRAVKAGAKVVMPVQDMFWGDRYGRVEDPFGFNWQIATHIEDVSPREMAKRAQAAFSAGGQ